MKESYSRRSLSVFTKGLLILLFSTLFPKISLGQEEINIKGEVLKYSDSVTQIISNGRLLLFEKLTAGDLVKARSIKDYLLTQTVNGERLIFYPNEYRLILYWLHDYPELLDNLYNEDSVMRSVSKKIPPERDIMSLKIYSRTIANQQLLTDSIRNSGISEIEKDFLVLDLEYLMIQGGVKRQQQDTLNKKANAFLSKYPRSRYEGYVRKNIRYEFVLSNGGFGVELYGGYGMFAGGLSNNFSNMGMIGVAANVQYKWLTFFLKGGSGFGKTRVDIPYKYGVWTKNSATRSSFWETSIGYCIKENNTYKLQPYVGIGAMTIEASHDDSLTTPQLKYAGLDFNTYMLGFSADLKLGAKEPFSYWQEWKICCFLRIRYAYCMPRFPLKNPGVAGGYHSITLGVGAIDRHVRRRE